MLMVCALPATLCADKPGSRARDSAMLTSGNFPMSSAAMASTMLSDIFLTEIAPSTPLRIPVTVTTSVSFLSPTCEAAILRRSVAALLPVSTIVTIDPSSMRFNASLGDIVPETGFVTKPRTISGEKIS